MKRHFYIAKLVLICMVCVQCSLDKKNNLAKFLKNEKVSFNLDRVDFQKGSQRIKLKKDFTISFWMKSNNFSKNGVVFNIFNKKDDNLRNSALIFLLSNKKASIISGYKDYRKIDNSFQKKFSKEFKKLRTLNLNERYFVTCVYRENEKLFKIYVDDQLYTEYSLKFEFNEKPLFLNFGSIIDQGRSKYFFSGKVENFYIFETAFSRKKFKLLMNLTLTKTFPLDDY